MVQFNIILFWFCCLRYIDAYRNRLYTIASLDEYRTSEYQCAVYEGVTNDRENDLRKNNVSKNTNSSESTVDIVENPYDFFQQNIHKFLYGQTVELEDETNAEIKLFDKDNNKTDYMSQYVIGNYFHAELFNNRSGVHLPQLEYMYRGHCLLNVTRDYMQTAVNAFAIFLHGTIKDIKELPADYVLRSSRTISMMNIAREKLAATWNVVKGNKNTEDVTCETLEMYRPLFKYINGREISRLNLTDDKILTYIGTHADLDRHQALVKLFERVLIDVTTVPIKSASCNCLQNASSTMLLSGTGSESIAQMVGVIASRYIEVNPYWTQPKYLNIMNNLLCGVPMTFMRKLPENTYLQLSHQIFYHIRACDPLQRRFFLSMMTRTPALGKSYSWNARDVSRLGVLLAEVDGEDLSLIKPEAMSGISSQVMEHIPVQHLKFLTVIQVEHLARKPLNIYIRKVKFHEEELQLYGDAIADKSNLFLTIFMMFCVIN